MYSYGRAIDSQPCLNFQRQVLVGRSLMPVNRALRHGVQLGGNHGLGQAASATNLPLVAHVSLCVGPLLLGAFSPHLRSAGHERSVPEQDLCLPRALRGPAGANVCHGVLLLHGGADH